MIEPVPAADPIARSALRKASLHLIPLIALGYGVAYMDRVNISFASLQMNRDLHFSNTIYGFGAGLFFLAYAACELPSNLLLYRFGARRWLARIMITWGFIAVAMIFVRTPIQFYAARFFLGMAEAGFFPGVVFYLTQWFPLELRARTVSRFYVSLPLSSAAMGAVAGALLNLQGRFNLAGWQWLFLVEALPAILLGIAFLLFLPDTPAQATWLTPTERTALLALNPPSSEHHSIAPALRDSRVWLLGLFMFLMLACSYAYAFSAPAILLKSTGLSITLVGFITTGFGLLGALSMITGAIFSDRLRTPYAFAIPGCLFVSAGFLTLGLTSTAAPSIAGLIMIVIGYYGMQGPIWGIATAFFTGRCAAAAIAVMNALAILGGFFAPLWMGYARDLTGNYQRGLLTMSTPMLIAVAILFHLRARSRRECASALEPVPSLP